MGEQNYKKTYSLQDLNKAFDMGLETAIFVIEKMLGLTPDGQLAMLNALKERIQKVKTDVSQSS